MGAVGPLLNPALVQASAEFGISLTTFNEGINGALICCLAGGTTILNGLAVVIGKRPAEFGGLYRHLFLGRQRYI